MKWKKLLASVLIASTLISLESFAYLENKPATGPAMASAQQQAPAAVNAEESAPASEASVPVSSDQPAQGPTSGSTITASAPAASVAVASSVTFTQTAGETGSSTAYNGSTTYDQGFPRTDPIYNVLPQLHCQFKTGDGNLTDGFTTNMDMFNSPLDGFSGFKARYEYAIGDVFYRVYTEEHGWTRWAMNSMDTDWFNDAAKVTAIQIRTKGYTRNCYDIYYRVTLEDGTVLDWAHDGQTAGTIGTGHYIQKMQVALWKHGLSFYQPTQKHFLGANIEGIVFDGSGMPRYSRADGSAYTGWAYDTDNNKYYFENSAPVSGWKTIGSYKYYFNEKGMVVTDLEPIMGKTGDYIIKVNKSMKTMTIYTKNPDTGDYTLPYKVFLCTIGSATPTGTFKTYEAHRWKYMHDDLYVQYLLRYKAGGFCIHSIIYEPAEGSYNLVANTYNELGKNFSDGCIRLTSGDAAWVYENCGEGASLTIYQDEWVMGPFDRPAIEQAIPLMQRYDPTDPVVIQDMQNHTGPFAGGSYNGQGYDAAYGNPAAVALNAELLVSETAPEGTEVAAGPID